MHSMVVAMSLAAVLFLVPISLVGASPATVPSTQPAQAVAYLGSAVEFSRHVEDAVRQRDQTGLAAALDGSLLLTEALKDLPVGPGYVLGVRLGFGNPSSHVASDLLRILGTADVRFLRVVGEPAAYRALYRIIDHNDGVNYLEMPLESDAAGALKVSDVYIYSTGEAMSAMLRRRLILGFARHQTAARAAEQKSELGRHFQEVDQLLALNSAGKVGEAEAIYSKLPPAVQRDRTVMLAHLHDCRLQGEPQYRAAVAACNDMYPHDPSLLLDQIDGLWGEKRWDDLLSDIDELDRRVDGDPHLELFRAAAYTQKGDRTKARACLERVMASEPNYRLAYLNAINLAVQDKDYAATRRLMSRIEKRGLYRFDQAKVEQIDAFAGFVQSPYYQQWLRDHRQLPAVATKPTQPAKSSR